MVCAALTNAAWNIRLGQLYDADVSGGVCGFCWLFHAVQCKRLLEACFQSRRPAPWRVGSRSKQLASSRQHTQAASHQKCSRASSAAEVHQSLPLLVQARCPLGHSHQSAAAWSSRCRQSRQHRQGATGCRSRTNGSPLLVAAGTACCLAPSRRPRNLACRAAPGPGLPSQATCSMLGPCRWRSTQPCRLHAVQTWVV